MEYAYATLLLNESNQEINEKNLTAVLEASGNTVEASRIKALVAALEGVDLNDIADDIDSDGGDPTALTDPHSNGDAATAKETDVDTPPDEDSDEFEFEPSNEAATES